MQVANVMVSLGGDIGNTVPKYGVTAAEVALLRAIHGEDAVYDIEVIGTVDRPSRNERARLFQIYGRAKDEHNKPIIEKVYPGAAARLFENFDELDLVDAQFKAVRTVRPAVQVPETPTPQDTTEPVKPLVVEDPLLAALAQLRPDVDAHWTKDGRPDLKALTELLGRRVSRAEVDEIASDFSRPVAVEEIVTTSDDGDEVEELEADDETGGEIEAESETVEDVLN